MIIDIEPGAKVNVPTQADFLVRMESAFSSGELAGVIPALEYRKYDGSAGEIAGSVSGTDFLFLVTPSIFSPGEWTINPRATVSSKVRRWPLPAVLVFGDPLTAGANCGC